MKGDIYLCACRIIVVQQTSRQSGSHHFAYGAEVVIGYPAPEIQLRGQNDGMLVQNLDDVADFNCVADGGIGILLRGVGWLMNPVNQAGYSLFS